MLFRSKTILFPFVYVFAERMAILDSILEVAVTEPELNPKMSRITQFQPRSRYLTRRLLILLFWVSSTLRVVPFYLKLASSDSRPLIHLSKERHWAWFFVHWSSAWLCSYAVHLCFTLVLLLGGRTETQPEALTGMHVVYTMVLVATSGGNIFIRVRAREVVAVVNHFMCTMRTFEGKDYMASNIAGFCKYRDNKIEISTMRKSRHKTILISYRCRKIWCEPRAINWRDCIPL